MKKFFFLLPLLSLLLMLDNLPEAQSQDERSFRESFLPQETKIAIIEKKDVLVQTDSPFYEFDLNNDGRVEFIKTFKKDGLDLLQIYNHNLIPFPPFEFPLQGHNSWIYRLHFHSISSSTKVMIVSYFEGHSGSPSHQQKSNSTTRLYFITWENNNLQSMKMFKGPIIAEENSQFPRRSFRRFYNLNLEDLNQDNQKEIHVRFGQIDQIYTYKGKGLWSSL